VSAQREVRVVQALLGELWAYFSSLRRGELVAAPSILEAFQQDYNTYRGSLVDYVRSAGASIDVPPALGIDGVWGRHTRGAAMAVIRISRPTAWAHVPAPPRVSEQLGAWWWTHLAGTVSAGMPPWDAVNATVNQGANAGTVLSQWAFGYVEGIGGAQTTSAPVGSGGLLSPEAMRGMLQSGPASRVAALLTQMSPGERAAMVGSGADLPGGSSPTTLDPLFIAGRPPRADRPAWPYYVIGAGVLALGGALTFNAWRRSR